VKTRWLLGEKPPAEGVEPDELFEKLVAEDIESGGHGETF